MANRQAEAERSLHNQINILPRGQLIVVFAVLALSQLISFTDQNGIGVALPTIANELQAESTISWAGTSSLIANTTFQMLYGRLSDIFGRKVVWLAAIGCLFAATLSCSLSRTPGTFYLFRGIAGVGGGGLSNLSMIIVSDVVTLEQRGKFQGIIGACVGIGNVTGPFLAATVITNFTWRAFFWVVAPLVAIVGGLSAWLLPSQPPALPFRQSIWKVDYVGVLFSSVGVTLLLIPISGGGSYFRWHSPLVMTMLAVGSASLVIFILWEWRVAKLPMMPLTIFQNPAVSILLVQSVLFGAVYQSYLFYLPLYLQNARQYSVIQSAGVISAMVGVQAVSSLLSGLYISHFRRWKEVLYGGFSFWAVGAGLLLLLDRHTPMGMIIAPLVIIGIGIGAIFQPTLVALQAHVPRSRRAVIISNRNFFRCAGGATGLAVSAAVLQATLRISLPEGHKELAHNAYALPKVEGPGFDAVLNAYMEASRAVFTLQVPLIGVCLLGTVFLKDHGLAHPEGCDQNNHNRRDDDNQVNNDGRNGYELEAGINTGSERRRKKLIMSVTERAVEMELTPDEPLDEALDIDLSE